MAGFNYTRAQATAERLIERFGATGTLERPTSTGPSYNPVPGEPDRHAVRLVVTEYRLSEIDGTRVLATDRRVYLAARNLAVEPRTSDRLVIAGVSYAIVDVRPLAPAGTVVVYELQVRR